jgi:hypothetical protein
MSSSEKKEPLSLREVMSKASASAVRGGTAGAVAMFANVGCLMWMRTTVREKEQGLLCLDVWCACVCR